MPQNKSTCDIFKKEVLNKCKKWEPRRQSNLPQQISITVYDDNSTVKKQYTFKQDHCL